MASLYQIFSLCKHFFYILFKHSFLLALWFPPSRAKGGLHPKKTTLLKKEFFLLLFFQRAETVSCPTDGSHCLGWLAKPVCSSAPPCKGWHWDKPECVFQIRLWKRMKKHFPNPRPSLCLPAFGGGTFETGAMGQGRYTPP